MATSQPVDQQTHSKKSLVLGIEGGATKTEWVYLSYVNNTWTSLQKGKLPAANFKLITEDQLRELLTYLPKEVNDVGVYLPGVLTPEDRSNLHDIARSVWPDASIRTGSDRDSGLASSFGDGDGIFIISGTGSSITGRAQGRVAKAGGKGHLVGDKGSAYAVAMDGLRLVMDRHDEMDDPCALGAAILRDLALNRIDDIIDWIQVSDKPTVARLATVVFQVFLDTNDEDILRILKTGVESLAHSTAVVAKRLSMREPEVSLHGSMFTKQAQYVSLFNEALKKLLPGAIVTVYNDSGAIGAARLAIGFKSDACQNTSQCAGRVSSLSAGESDSASSTANFVDSNTANTAVTKRTGTTSPLLEMESALTEQRNERSMSVDTMSNLELVDLFVEEERYVRRAVGACREAIASAIEAVTRAINSGGHLYYVGAGTSGRLGTLDASEIPPTFGEPPTTVQAIIAGGPRALHRSVEGAEDDPVAGGLSVTSRGVTNGDVVCGITACGRTPFVLGALDRAKKIGATTIFITSNPNHPCTDRGYDIHIVLVTGPELVTGSTRLKAGTATKVTLNLITTGAMIRLGRVKSNLMVSLRASNTKLQDRASRLVCQETGCSYQDAFRLLAANAWNVKTVLQQHSMQNSTPQN